MKKTWIFKFLFIFICYKFHYTIIWYLNYMDYQQNNLVFKISIFFVHYSRLVIWSIRLLATKIKKIIQFPVYKIKSWVKNPILLTLTKYSDDLYDTIFCIQIRYCFIMLSNIFFADIQFYEDCFCFLLFVRLHLFLCVYWIT